MEGGRGTLEVLGWRGKGELEVAIDGINKVGGVGGLEPTRPGGRVDKPQGTRAAAGDRVELSPEAKLLSKIHELPGVRTDKVDAARHEIARGTYETSDKIDALVDRLLAEFRGGAV